MLADLLPVPAGLMIIFSTLTHPMLYASRIFQRPLPPAPRSLLLAGSFPSSTPRSSGLTFPARFGALPCLAALLRCSSSLGLARQGWKNPFHLF